ncbi:HEAT repeat domain-containing protein, partial [bacterium]|nr:HEAT repeat domain-containing protein [bacterium]
KRLKAVKLLGKLKTPLAVDPLKTVLMDRSKEVRCAAVEALASIKPSNLSDLLLPSSKDRSADVRLRVAFSFSGLEDNLAVSSLFELLEDPKDEVANMAARGLAKIPTKSITQLIRQFRNKSWKIRSRAAEAIRRIGKPASEALCNALTDSDSNVRFWASLSLGHLRDKNFSKQLLSMLSDVNTGVRVAALRALRQIGDPTVVGKIFEALSQPSEQIRDAIYEILRDFGTHSIPFLMESLSSEYWISRSLAAQALIEMGSDSIMPLTSALESQDKERRYWAIKILGQMKEASTFQEVKRLLSDSDSEIRMAAVQAMGDFLHPDSIPLLIERFTDSSWVVRREAHYALVKFGEQGIDLLIKSLDSPEEDVRYWVLRSLGKINPSNLLPILVKLLKDKSWNIRKTAAEILGNFGEPVLPDLMNLAQEADSEVRFWILQALGKIGSLNSLPILFQALDDISEAIRNSAQKALVNYGPSIVDDLLPLLKSDQRRLLESVSLTLQQMPSNVMVPKLCQLLGKGNDHLNYWLRRTLEGFGRVSHKSVKNLRNSKANEVRRQAVLAFSAIGSSEDAEDLIPFLKDEHWPVRIATAETLGFLKNREAVEPLMNALEDDDEDLSLAATKSLGLLGDERAVPALLFALNRESWALRFHILSMLGKMKVKRAVPDLLKLFDEDSLDLKISILKTLGEIGHPES